MLLPEFAVEPELLNSWERVRLFAALFGLENGRLVSRFPKKWLQKACKAVYGGPDGDVDRHRCIEMLQRLKDTAFIDCSRPWPSEPRWIDNALKSHRERPFHAIVAPDGFENECVVPWDDVHPDHPFLRVETGITIERKAECMAECVATLLRTAKEVVFVDRNFVPTGRKWTEPLGAFLRRIADRADLNSLRRVEVHTAIGESDSSVYRANCERELKQIVPPGLTLSVVLCEWSELHDRFVLTERRGFKFGHGLDAPLRENPGRVHVNLLSESQWREEWEKHQGRSPLCTIRA